MVFRKFGYNLFVLFVLFAIHPALGLEPIQLQNNPLDGEYIGKHVTVLNEKEVFSWLAPKWNIDEVFKQKMLSGELHSDNQVQLKIVNLPDGYRAEMNRAGEQGQSQGAEWRVTDVMRKELLPKFKAAGSKIFSLNFMPHSHWLRFQISNNSPEERHLILELDRYWFSYAHLFVAKNGEVLVQRGDFNLKIDERKVRHKNIAFNITVLPGTNTYYLRVDSWYADVIPLRLWSNGEFYNHVAFDSALLGIIVGVFLFIFVYNLFIYSSVRDPSYIYLSLMTLCGLATHLSGSGLGFQFIWPNNPIMGFQVLYLFLPLSFMFFLLFCRSFIEIPKVTPKFDKIIVALSILFLIFALTVFIPGLNQKFFLMSLVFEHLYYWPIIFPAVLAIKKGNRAGLFLMIGISLHLLSSMEWFLSNLDIIPYQLMNYLQLKGVSFLLIMTLGLADKINVMKKSLSDLNINLEAKVTARTEELFKKTEELSTANIKLTELDKIKTRFFTNVSHELRTPLTLVLAPLNSFLKGDYGKISKANLYIFESMKRNGDRLLKLINDLLDFSKIEADGMVVDKRQCNFTDLLSDCVSNAETGASSQGIQISFEDKTDGLMMLLDPELMEKAVYNLLGNAIKFNKPGGSIQVSLSQREEECYISITDSGIGIPGDKLESIFDRFGQADTSITRKYEGTGIGLALVKEIVQLHDGHIQVESNLDQGTKFVIVLPIYPLAKEPSSEVRNESPIDEESHKISSSRLSEIDQASVLIVEDNQDMATYLDGLLSKHYQTTVAYNGIEALEKFDKTSFDLVLADLMMPEMDGYELLEKIRARDEHLNLPVIFLTAKTDVPGKIEGFEKGVNDYVTKPFDPEELLARIHSQLKFKQLKENLLVRLKKESTKKSITETTRIKVETVKQFIHNNFREDLYREQLAEAVEMSPDHLGRSFKEIVGQKISEYLNKIRVDEASKKLRESDEKVIDIAFGVGFGSLRSFNKAFQDIVGDTPSNYRRTSQ
jgi:signal transduction histidine kinase/DNA-binding response OmpR family regulator